MHRHSLELLDFLRIRELLASYCTTCLGSRRALELEPFSDRKAIELEFDRLDEIMAMEEEPPLIGIEDITGLLQQAGAGGVLTGKELLRVRAVCEAIRICRDFFQRQGERLVATAELVNGLGCWPDLESEISWAIDETGEVRDAASPELQRVRAELRRRRNGIVRQLEEIIAQRPEWFEGPVMMRGDRLVVPLRQEARGQLAGVVHGTSASGYTFFVEPLQTVAEQNELQELRDTELKEQARILRRLSALVAQHQSAMTAALSAAAAIDLIVAKRRFNHKFGCTRPEISDDCALELVKARHPLLLTRGVEVAPLDLSLPSQVNVLLISGPNAGGKTVALKTVGLSCLMALSGMFVPAASACLPVLDRVLADIGDEQSLDLDLSSFTAHLLRLKEFVELADKRTLVVIDEIGASTDPEEGAALAVAVLEAMRDSGAICLATTHLAALKLFVRNEQGMMNAAMEYRGRPTYRLVLGALGESSAFEVAERAGLPVWLLERARRRMSSNWFDIKEKVRSLARDCEEAEQKRKRAEASLEAAEEVRREYEAKLNEFSRWRAIEESKVRAEAERVLRDMRREVENLVRQIRERNADRQSIVEAKRFVEERLAKLTDVRSVPQEDRETAPLPVGAVVSSRRFARQGTVVRVDGRQVVVAFGSIRVTLDSDDLELVSVPEQTKHTAEFQEPFLFDPRLDIRGMDRWDAIDAVDRFIDDAHAAGVRKVTIVHGLGNGVLRRTLWEKLKSDRRVERMALAEPEDGGMGATWVWVSSVSL